MYVPIARLNQRLRNRCSYLMSASLSGTTRRPSSGSRSAYGWLISHSSSKASLFFFCMRLGIPRQRIWAGIIRVNVYILVILHSGLTPSPGSLDMDPRAAHMPSGNRRCHQTYPHRKPHYRHHFACHCPGWLVQHEPMRRRLIRSTRRPLETGAVDGHSFDSSSLTSSLCFCCKGVIWLALAAVAEVPPVVCGLTFSAHLSVQSVRPCSTVQVLIILNLGGNAFLSMTYD